MKSLNTFLTASLVTMVFTAAQAENRLGGLIYEDSSNMFSTVTSQSSEPVGILSFGDDHNQNLVWSTEFEQYVNPANFEKSGLANIDDVNQYMSSNPTAAGSIKNEPFIFNEMAGEYQLQ
jgi:hypothetical protein